MGLVGLAGLSAVFGFGIFVSFMALNLEKIFDRKYAEKRGGGFDIADLAEKRIFQAMIADFSQKIHPIEGDLEVNLRKSGGVYASMEEFYSRRIYGALIFVLVTGIMGFTLGLGTFSTAVLATLGAGFGFMQPEKGIQKGMDRRRDRVVLEMTYALDRIALMATADTPTYKALESVRDAGLFGLICYQISQDLAIGKKADDIMKAAREEVPTIPELEEFLKLVQDNMKEGYYLEEPLRQKAEFLRERLENLIIIAGGKEKINVLLISAGFILVASLIVTLAPTLAQLSSSGGF